VLDVRARDRFLDVGCGTGAAVRGAAALPPVRSASISRSGWSSAPAGFGDVDVRKTMGGGWAIASARR